jgi:thymidine phosphorylase
VRALTIELSARMLSLAGAVSEGEAVARATRALDSGAAWERFTALVAAQGGDATAVGRPGVLPAAPVIAPVTAPRAGVLAAVDAFGIGELVVALGGGRRAKEDGVDPRVGLMVRRRIGDPVTAGEPLAELHLAGADEAAVRRARACFRVGDEPTPPPELVIERVD